MKKKILLILTIALIAVGLASAALAERVDNDTHKVVDLLHNMKVCKQEYYLVELTYGEGTTETLRCNFTRTKRDEYFDCYALIVIIHWQNRKSASLAG